jgi:ribosomal protein S18 acetylase RimI-like enzyme
LATFEIRVALPADMAAIVALDQAANADERRRHKVTEAILAHRCLVAESDKAIVGYGVVTRDFFDHGFIALLFIAPAMRRRGIGSSIMEALEAAAPTAKLFTSTNRSNAAMRSLLMKRGYREVGAIQGLEEDDSEAFYLKLISAGGSG